MLHRIGFSWWLLGLVAACGGGGDGGGGGPVDPTPPPVSSIILSMTSAALVPGQSVDISATARSASGATLTGRVVTWESSAPAVASVSTTGTVTALGQGTAEVTATSEGKSASATIAVAFGGLVGPAGATVVADSGRVTLVIPPGALATPTAIEIRPGIPPNGTGRLFSDRAWLLLPASTTLATPATLTMKYQAGSLDSLQMLLVAKRYANGSWVAVPGSTVDGKAGTVSVPITSFGPAAQVAARGSRLAPPAAVASSPVQSQPFTANDLMGCPACYAVAHQPIITSFEYTPAFRSLFVSQSFTAHVTVRNQWGEIMNSGFEVLWGDDVGLDVQGSYLSASITGTMPGDWRVGPTVIQRYDCPNPNGRCYIGTVNNPVLGPVEMWMEDWQRAYSLTATRVIVERVAVKSVTVAPATSQVTSGGTVQLSAVPRDSASGELADRPVTWTTSNPNVATVSTSGLVTTLAPGLVTITATCEGISGTAQVTVVGSASPVVTVTITSPTQTIEVGGTVQFTAVGRDAQDNVVSNRPVTWTALEPAIASVSTTGLVTGIAAGGPVGIRATIDGISRTRNVLVTAPVPEVHGQVAAGERFVCLRRDNGTTWCWGQGKSGQLGNGTTPDAQPSPVQVPFGPFTSLVAGGMGAGVVNPEQNHACGISAGSAYCWGGNPVGQLGDGSTTQRNTPVAVSEGAFSQLFLGHSWRTCGLRAGGDAWCWGSSTYGHGNSGVSSRSVPTPIVNAPPFKGLAVGASVTCGLSMANAAWCWGSEDQGEMGDGGSLFGIQDNAVLVGGHAFTQLVSGGYHFCGLKADGSAMCWGENSGGQLGDGTTTDRGAPVAVQGGHSFTTLSAGPGGTCGLKSDQTIWCWGDRSIAGAALGSPQKFTTPAQVPGTMKFTSISVGGFHACADAVDGLWCWGNNQWGQLGNGTTDLLPLGPVRVIFPP